MTVWYTSDLHLGHERIIELSRRPFATVQEMNDALVYNWNARVAPTDTVWVLGDVVMHKTALKHVRRLHGTKMLVAGNHDSCWSYHKRYVRAIALYREAGFDTVFASGCKTPGTHRVGATPVNLAHLPYRGAGDHTATERYAEQRLLDDGLPLLCGHVHDAWLHKRTPAGTPMINVGVDMWGYAPVAADTVEALLYA